MKETAAATSSLVGGGSSSNAIRSSIDKDKTRLRERQRRSITTKIFHGLRKHGGYRLSPRADINQVLRHLAQEAGWVVEPDGTTYRYRTPTTTTTKGFDLCPVCGAGRRSGTSTPTSSYIASGDCSAGSLTVSERNMVFGVGNSVGIPSTGGAYNRVPENALGMYMYSGELHHQPMATGVEAAYHHNQQLCLKEAKASNQNTLDIFM